MRVRAVYFCQGVARGAMASGVAGLFIVALFRPEEVVTGVVFAFVAIMAWGLHALMSARVEEHERSQR